MNLESILLDGLWSALFATAMSIRNSTPFKYIIPTFISSVIAVLTRDSLEQYGLSTNWSTLFAAFMIVLSAGLFIRSQRVPPVVMVCSVLPLWASVSMFGLLNDLRKVSLLSGSELNAAAIDLTANTAIVFIITVSIALGFAAGLALLNLLFRRESIEDSIIDAKDDVPFVV
ncbi:MAG TPA: threonine/serine exporter family protein [Ignavibacteria bacterium]|nr:threonine/serine exporter family protein [Ignavibacteria bacterium]